MMKRKTWLTIGIAALLLFCTAVLAEGANRNVPLDSALDAALNAPGSGIAFANGSAHPWQVVEIDGRTAAKSGNAGAANSSSAVSAQVTIAEGQSLSFDWNVGGEPTTGALAMWDYLVFIVDGEYIDYIHSVEENTPLGWETFTWTPEEAGTYTVEWAYNKDASNNSGADCGYLDNVAVIGEPVQTAAPTAEPQPGEEFTIFEEDFSQLPSDEWWNDDMDGDGSYWHWDTSCGHNAPGALYSLSYSSSGPLTPDNWVCIPYFDIPADAENVQLSFWLSAFDEDFYAEHIDVCVISIYENYYGYYDYEILGTLDSITLDSCNWRKYTCDLSDYVGEEELSIAFMHCNCTDQSGVILDDIAITATVGGELPCTPGDVDFDGRVTVGDALTVMRHALNVYMLPEAALPAADVDADGNITVADALQIMRIALFNQ